MRGEASFGSHALATFGELDRPGVAIVAFEESGELLSTARLSRGLVPSLVSDKVIVGLCDAVSDLDRTWDVGSPYPRQV